MNTIPVEVRISGGFLVATDIRRFPAEKEIKTLVDEDSEQRGVDKIVPHRGGREDGFTAEKKVQEGGSIASVSQVA